MSRFGAAAGGGVQAFAFFAYMALGLFQMAAVIGGLEDWLGLNWVFALILSLPLAYMPVVGTVLGVLGAHTAWHWSWGLSLALFLGPMVIILALGLILSGAGVIAYGVQKARTRLAR